MFCREFDAILTRVGEVYDGRLRELDVDYFVGQRANLFDGY